MSWFLTHFSIFIEAMQKAGSRQLKADGSRLHFWPQMVISALGYRLLEGLASGLNNGRVDQAVTEKAAW
jgi:hypothetical protein